MSDKVGDLQHDGVEKRDVRPAKTEVPAVTPGQLAPQALGLQRLRTTPRALLALQGTAGNRAVMRLLRRTPAGALVQREGPDAGTPTDATATTDTGTPGAGTGETTTEADRTAVTQATAIIDALAPDPGRVIGAHQIGRVQSRWRGLNDEQKIPMARVFMNAASDVERLYVFKAFASGHTAEELQAFGNDIRGRDGIWRVNNLMLTESTTGTGIRQQFSHSCNITMVEAVRGEADPIYSLEVHRANPNLSEVNPDVPEGTGAQNPELAARQRAGLERTYTGGVGGGTAGVAAPVNQASSGEGRWADDLLNSLESITGSRYRTKKRDADVTLAQIISIVKTNAGSGVPVALVIGTAADNYAHYVLVTRYETREPVRFMIHDPATGRTTSRVENQLANDRLNLTGGAYNFISAVEDPS